MVTFVVRGSSFVVRVRGSRFAFRTRTPNAERRTPNDAIAT